MVLYTPASLAARRGILMYFEQSEEASSQQTLFDWEWEKSNEGGMQMFGGGDSSNEPTYKVMEEDATFSFVKKALSRLGVQSLPNRSGARYGNVNTSRIRCGKSSTVVLRRKLGTRSGVQLVQRYSLPLPAVA